MARHSLIAGQDLIAALKKLGIALGYDAVTEYPIDPEKANPQAIDVVWKRDKEQRFPLMVFEVESTASNAAASNPLKLYSKRNFEKPLFFFHVFINAGKHTSRLDDLREEYGKMNYRTYTLRSGDTDLLLNDILDQHRRLSNRLDVMALVCAMRETCLAQVDCHAKLAHAESLGFNKGRGVTLPAYARLCVGDPSFSQDFYRYLTKRRHGALKRENERYVTYFGDSWVTPLYYGILSSWTAPLFRMNCR